MEPIRLLFYLLAGVILSLTVMAVSCRHALHAALYFIGSLLGLALLFFLLGAPLLAALEVILYAGAIMMLILFVVMMVQTDQRDRRLYRPGHWVIPGALVLLAGCALFTLLAGWPGGVGVLPTALVTPRQFGIVLFRDYWLAVELVSLILFVALVGALYLGEQEGKGQRARKAEGEGS